MLGQLDLSPDITQHKQHLFCWDVFYPLDLNMPLSDARSNRLVKTGARETTFKGHHEEAIRQTQKTEWTGQLAQSLQQTSVNRKKCYSENPD